MNFDLYSLPKDVLVYYQQLKIKPELMKEKNVLIN